MISRKQEIKNVLVSVNHITSIIQYRGFARFIFILPIIVIRAFGEKGNARIIQSLWRCGKVVICGAEILYATFSVIIVYARAEYPTFEVRAVGMFGTEQTCTGCGRQESSQSCPYNNKRSFHHSIYIGLLHHKTKSAEPAAFHSDNKHRQALSTLNRKTSSPHRASVQTVPILPGLNR